MYMFAITGDNGEPIGKSSPAIVCHTLVGRMLAVDKMSTLILSIGIKIRYSRVESDDIFGSENMDS